MRRAAKPPKLPALVFGWLLLGFVPFVPHGMEGVKTGGWIVLGFMAALLVWLTVHTLVSRVTVEGTTLTMRALQPRKRLRTAVGEIVRYATDAEGRWWVETAERRVQVPVPDPWELHAAMVEVAPTKLNAKRLRAHRLPPPEDFRSLWVYDTDGLLSETLARIAALLPLVLLTRQPGGAAGILVGPLLFGALDMAKRLDVTRDGIVQRGPLHRREIPWGEATAIFCERPKTKRRFVVTSGATAIEIPEHLAKDLDLMDKVLCSLPDRVLCVNFDETTFRGYRRRKEAREKPRSESLNPILAE